MKQRLVAPLFGLVVVFLMLGAPMASHAGAPSKSDAKSKPVGNERHVLVDNVTTTIFTNGVVAGSIRADVVIDVPQSKVRARVEELVPRFRALAHSVMQDYAYREYRPGVVIDADALRAGFQAEVDGLIGAGNGRVYLTFLILHGG
jgi:hypothetical protein